MTELLSHLDAPSDAELISRVRGGDSEAYGVLFSRHVESARRLARQLVRGHDADDLVSDAFAKVWAALQAGGGPDVAFRAYLLTAVRRLHVDRVRAQSRLTTSDDMTEFDPGVPFRDTAVAKFESGAAARAFSSLPERWQLVLWHLEVEGQKPADVAPLLGMSPNSVSALAYRAREGLRQAFLSAHLNDIAEADCRWVTEHLGGYVRKGLSKRDNAKVSAHLDGCRSCAGMHLEVTEVNSNLAGIIAPLLLGALAAGYVSSAGTTAAAGGLIALADRAKDVVVAHMVPVAAGTAAASVAAVTVVGATISPLTTNQQRISGQPPIAVQDGAAVAGTAPRVAAPFLGPSPAPDELFAVLPLDLPLDPGATIDALPSDAPLLPTDVLPFDLPTDAATDPAGLPTDVPTEAPTGEPTPAPGEEGTAGPVPEPTAEPTAAASPSAEPGDPGTDPTAGPTTDPTGEPTADPTPGSGASQPPLDSPTGEPSATPTAPPVVAPGQPATGGGDLPGAGNGGTGGGGGGGDPTAPTAAPTTQPATPLDPAPPVADLRVGSVQITGGTASVALSGLPDAPVKVRITLRSASGTTTFAPTATGVCEVPDNRPWLAVCDTRDLAWSGRVASTVFPRQLQAVLPLAYPATLETDVLRFTARVAKHVDPRPRDNHYRVAFAPERLTPGLPGLPLPTLDPSPGTPSDSPASPPASPTDGPTGQPSPTSDPTATPTSPGQPGPGEGPSGTETPAANPSADPTETPAATPSASPTEGASAPAQPTPTESPTETPTETPAETPAETPTESPAAGPIEPGGSAEPGNPGEPGSPTEPGGPTATSSPAPSASPSPGEPATDGTTGPGGAAGSAPTSPEPSSPFGVTVSPDPAPGPSIATSPGTELVPPPAPPTADLAVTADRRRVGTSTVGLFRITLRGVPVSPATPVELQVHFNHPRVFLEQLPSGCWFVSQRAGRVRCEVTAASSFSAHFDAELARVGQKRTVVATVHAWLPGHEESDRGDNVTTVRLRNTDPRAEWRG